MSYSPPPAHPSLIAAQQKGTIAPEMLIPVWAGLSPLVVMLEPHIDFDAMWRIVNANAQNGIAGVFNALETNASVVITSPSFEATLFAMGCRVAANLWTHGALAVIALPPAPPTPLAKQS
jgi:hypothetical protein